ncbi:MAG: hypothetical protein NTX86_04950 [Candidatus Dependentiae bacterium]|nr:hypothetical protein [Candidatus Dependentiae bacterium]
MKRSNIILSAIVASFSVSGGLSLYAELNLVPLQEFIKEITKITPGVIRLAKETGPFFDSLALTQKNILKNAAALQEGQVAGKPIAEQLPLMIALVKDATSLVEQSSSFIKILNDQIVKNVQPDISVQLAGYLDLVAAFNTRIKNAALNFEKVLAASGSFITAFTQLQQKVVTDFGTLVQARTANTSIMASLPSIIATTKDAVALVDQAIGFAVLLNDRMLKGPRPELNAQIATYLGYGTMVINGIKSAVLALEKVATDSGSFISLIPPLHQKIMADIAEINQSITANLSFMVRLKAVVIVVKDLTGVVDVLMGLAKIFHEQIIKSLEPQLSDSLVAYYAYWDTFHKVAKLVVVALEKAVAEATDPLNQLQQKFMSDMAALQGAKTSDTASLMLRLPLMKDIAEIVDLMIRISKSFNEQTFRDAVPSVYAQFGLYIGFIEAFNADIKNTVDSLAQIYSAFKQ